MTDPTISPGAVAISPPRPQDDRRPLAAFVAELDAMAVPESLQAAVDRAWAVALKLHAEQRFTDTDARQLKAALKHAKERHAMPGRAVDEVIRELDALRLGFEARLPLDPNLLESPSTSRAAGDSHPADRRFTCAVSFQPAVLKSPAKPKHSGPRYHYLTRTPEEIGTLEKLLTGIQQVHERDERAALYRTGFCIDATAVPCSRQRDQQTALACDDSEDASLRRMIQGRGSAGAPLVVSDLLEEFCREHGIAPDRAMRRKVQRYVRKWRETQSVVDGRKARPVGRLGIPPMVQALILLHAIGGGRKGDLAVAHMVSDHLSQLKLDAEKCGVIVTATPPSRVTVARFVASLPATIKDARQKHVRDVLDARRPHDDYSRAERPNTVWEIDHSQVDVWVLWLFPDGRRVPARPYLMTCVDETTQFGIAFILTLEVPTAFTVSCLLYDAFTPWKTIARHETCRSALIRTDNGSIYVGKHAERVLIQNGIERVPMPPNDPTKNAEVERLFGTLKGQMQELTGYCGPKVAEDRRATERDTDRMLPAEALHEWLERKMLQHNTAIDPNAPSKTRAERWREALGAPVPEDFAWRLLHSDASRQFKNGTVEWNGDVYHIAQRQPSAPSLHDLHLQLVRIYYTPMRPERIWVTTYDEENPANERAVGMMQRKVPGEPTTPFTDEVFPTEEWALRSVRALKGLAIATDRARSEAALQERIQTEFVIGPEVFARPQASPSEPASVEELDPELRDALEPPPLTGDPMGLDSTRGRP